MTTRNRFTARAPFRRGTRPYGLQWGSTPLNLPLVTAGVGSQLSVDIGAQVETALGRTLAGSTVMRVRGNVILVGGATPLAGPHTVYFGIGWFSDGIDNGDFPDLSTGMGNWLFYSAFHYSGETAAGVAENLGALEGYVIDSKAMRKGIGNETNLMAVAQLAEANGDTTVFGHVRVLIKTP